ncbi:MAG: acyltransferase family protein, partial [bacterium]
MKNDERRFRPDVEGLRAVAVGLVVLGHAGVPWVPGGYIGVDVFFVLSGFLITGLLVRERATTGSTSMAGFYARRARRILPAASIVLVVTVLASYHWLGFLRGDAIAEDGKWTALFAANLHFAHEGTQYLNITAPPSPLQHYWSLAVEEQFYVVWPLVFVAVASVAPGVSLARKLASVLALIVVASLAWSIVQTRSDVTWAFFSPLTRAWELAVGALLAVGLSAVKRVPGKFGAWLSWGGLGAIIGGAVLFDNRTAFPGYAAALPVFGAAMVVAGGTVAPGRGAERLLGLAPFQVLGKWSYSLYLWHWPILMIAAQRAGHELPLAENLGLMGAAVVLAAVTHYVVENPVRYAPRLTRSPWTSIAVGACLLVAAFGVCAWQLRENTVGSPRLAYADAADATPAGDSVSAQSSAPKSPLEEMLAAVAAAPEINLLPADLTPGLASSLKDFAWLPPWGRGCLVDADVLDSPACLFGDPDGSKTVVLLGDSHVAQWMKAFDSIGKER